MTALRTVMFVAVSSLFVGCGSTTGTGTGGGGGSQTCTTNHQCTNGSCTCMGGSKAGSSCCDDNSTTCTTEEKCTAFCRTCM